MCGCVRGCVCVCVYRGGLTSSDAESPTAIKILPRSAHCWMVWLRASILSFSS